MGVAGSMHSVRSAALSPQPGKDGSGQGDLQGPRAEGTGWQAHQLLETWQRCAAPLSPRPLR